MKILHVTCSPRGEASESYLLSSSIVDLLLGADPQTTVINRVLGGDALSPIDAPYALSQQAGADVSNTGSLARSDALIEELQDADVLVIGTPMHNFTIPATLKLWLDHVARVRRTFNVGALGKTSLLRDRPVYVAVSSGGRFSGVNPRQPDFLTPYLKAVLAMIGLHDVSFFSVEGTAMGPDAVAAARHKTDQALHAHFSATCTGEANDSAHQALFTP